MGRGEEEGNMFLQGLTPFFCRISLDMQGEAEYHSSRINGVLATVFLVCPSTVQTEDAWVKQQDAMYE